MSKKTFPKMSDNHIQPAVSLYATGGLAGHKVESRDALLSKRELLNLCSRIEKRAKRLLKENINLAMENERLRDDIEFMISRKNELKKMTRKEVEKALHKHRKELLKTIETAIDPKVWVKTLQY